jgi:transposase-like protein
MKPLTPRVARCVELLRSGLNGQAVAREMGVHPASVSVWRRRAEALGHEVPQPDPSAGGAPRGTRAPKTIQPATPQAGAVEPDAPTRRRIGTLLRQHQAEVEAQEEWLRKGWSEFWNAEHGE